jgi:VIT1/CCC1 family predicted Fe2+/Mn2+ transporter
VEPSAEELLPADAVQTVIAAIRNQAIHTGGSDAVVEQILRATGLNLDVPTRSSLRATLNEILERVISKSMGRAEATRWLNQLVKQHGLAKPGS